MPPCNAETSLGTCPRRACADTHMLYYMSTTVQPPPSLHRAPAFLSRRETEASLLPSIFEWLYLRSTLDEKKLLSEPKTIENEESYISTNDWQRDRGARRAIQVLAGCQ